MAVDQSGGKFISAARPGGPGGNKVATTGDTGNPGRKARPGGIGQQGNTVGDTSDPTRKARPKSTGSGQTTNVRRSY